MAGIRLNRDGVTPPCWHDGNDCPRRLAGCHQSCSAWAEYEERKAAAKAKADAERRADAAYISYETHKRKRFDSARRHGKREDVT